MSCVVSLLLAAAPGNLVMAGSQAFKPKIGGFSLSIPTSLGWLVSKNTEDSFTLFNRSGTPQEKFFNLQKATSIPDSEKQMDAALRRMLPDARPLITLPLTSKAGDIGHLSYVTGILRQGGHVGYVLMGYLVVGDRAYDLYSICQAPHPVPLEAVKEVLRTFKPDGAAAGGSGQRVMFHMGEYFFYLEAPKGWSVGTNIRGTLTLIHHENQFEDFELRDANPTSYTYSAAEWKALRSSLVNASSASVVAVGGKAGEIGRLSFITGVTPPGTLLGGNSLEPGNRLMGSFVADGRSYLVSSLSARGSPVEFTLNILSTFSR